MELECGRIGGLAGWGPAGSGGSIGGSPTHPQALRGSSASSVVASVVGSSQVQGSVLPHGLQELVNLERWFLEVAEQAQFGGLQEAEDAHEVEEDPFGWGFVEYSLLRNSASGP